MANISKQVAYLSLMNAQRVVASVSLVLALSVSSLAQLTSADKGEILNAMGQIIREEAFVPGVDLGKWPTFLNKHRAEIDVAETNNQFANVVNGVLREFGVSHIVMSQERRRRDRSSETFEDFLLQGRGMARVRDEAGWLSDDVAYLRINSFVESYRPEQVEELIDEVRSSKGLVLDLRGNPGGLVGNMHHLLAQFLPNRTRVGTFITRKTAQTYADATKSAATDPIKIALWGKPNFMISSRNVIPYTGKLAVLLDEGSASASEIVASALQETKQAEIIGTKSAGAVLMSTFESLPHRFKLQFPISDYVSVKGRRLEANPLRPDVELSEDDTRSNRAVEVALKSLEG